MTQIATSLRATRDSARLIRFEPTAPITATNVQDALTQRGSIPLVPTSTAVTAAMSPYGPTNNDLLLLVDTSAGAVTVNLQGQAARNGLELIIKDDTGHASANPVSLIPNGGETIDGLSLYSIDGDYGGVTLAPQSGGYFIKP